MTKPPTKPTGHVIAYEHPHGSRVGGVVALSTHPAPGRRVGAVVRYVDRVPEGTTGRGAGRLLAEAVAMLPESAPVLLLLGVTFGGRTMAADVIEPSLAEARKALLEAARARGDQEYIERHQAARLDVVAYAVDVGPAATKVGKTFSLHQRIETVNAGLELGELRIPETIPRAAELRRVIHEYDPLSRVTAEGHDVWGADPYEGVLVALTVAFHEGQSGQGRIISPVDLRRTGEFDTPLATKMRRGRRPKGGDVAWRYGRRFG